VKLCSEKICSVSIIFRTLLSTFLLLIYSYLLCWWSVYRKTTTKPKNCKNEQIWKLEEAVSKIGLLKYLFYIAIIDYLNKLNVES